MPPIEFHFQWPGATELLVRGTFLLAAAWAVHFALGGLNPRWRVLLWRGAAAALLFLPLSAAVTPAFTVNLPAGAPLTGVLFSGSAASESSAVNWNALPWLAGLWGLGALISLGGILRASRGLRSLVREASQADEPVRALLTEVAQAVGYFGPLPDLRFSSKVGVPFACGVRRPVVVLPQSMTEHSFRAELPAVLAHEVSHLRTGDLGWSFLLQLLRCLLWFHPLARPVPGAHRAACEDVCNVAAAEYVGDVGIYSKTLARVALATINSPVMQGGIPMATRATVLRRLDFLKRGIAARPLPKAALGTFAVLALAALTGLSGLSLAVAAEKEQPQARAVDSSGYLMYAEVMPKIKSMPPRPEMPSEVVKAMVEKGDTALVTKLEFFVDESGEVNRELTRVTNASVFPELDRIALEWARQMKFEPALNKGQPVKVRMTIPVQWKAK